MPKTEIIFLKAKNILYMYFDDIFSQKRQTNTIFFIILKNSKQKDIIYHLIFPTLNLEYSKYYNSDSSSLRLTKYSGFPEYSVISQGPDSHTLMVIFIQGGKWSK